MDIRKVAFVSADTTTLVGAGAGTFFLTQNKMTIKNRLISKKINLISFDDEYLPAFKEYKDEESFKNLIKDGSSETSSWNEQQWAEALKKWCDDNIETELNQTKSDKTWKKWRNVV
ncbi:hypothetical protein A6V39_00515 [Candidatus Mycoplasma haematobovis]|uniref:Uncharacterized protein n=1 Tax=Candidatus Mycoplasma haematobovis TaxID=432608 RepID=A0A1A9QDJ0_9MOLU|nr:hypothetical protein [Candidatus Mycoplasma haematobovis]OAL10533.1 hypothetical protein A6V39_00515 [Candidatus Mycoplasma haematobovis]